VENGLSISAADQDPGCGAFLTPGSGIGKKSRSGSGLKILDHILELRNHFFGLKDLNFLMRIRDGKKVGSGMFIPDPQHWDLPV
jgi:hypothetical protein